MIFLILILIAIVVYNQGVSTQAHNARVEREHANSYEAFEEKNDV